MQAQDKKIIKTVLILVVCMAVILLLFLNKITTARYLSDIDLKINGLVLLEQPVLIEIENDKAVWVLVANTEKQKDVLDDLQKSFRKSVKKSTKIILAPIELQSQINKVIDNYSTVIAIINKENKLIGYLKPPFNTHKMLLTYSSVVAHR